MNKNVLVTGASGFVGRSASKYFSEKAWNVAGIGYGGWGGNEVKKWGIDKWHESKIDLDSLVSFGVIPDLIIHCAGSGSVANSYSNPKEDFEANVSSLLPTLEFMRLKCPNARLIYPSSAAVYGKKDDLAIKEDDLLDPISPYGYHKKVAEQICESYSKTFGLRISIIRFFSIYGPGLKKQLLWEACEKIRNSENEIEFFGTGDETRDWIHVRDASDLMYKEYEKADGFEIINGGSGRRTEVKSILEMLADNYGKKIKIVFNGKVKTGDPKYYLADVSKARRLDWTPKINIEKGLKEYVDYYKAKI